MALVRLHLDYRTQFSTPQNWQDVNVLAQQSVVPGHQHEQGIGLHDTPGETSSEKGRPRKGNLTVYSYMIRGFRGNAPASSTRYLRRLWTEVETH